MPGHKYKNSDTILGQLPALLPSSFLAVQLPIQAVFDMVGNLFNVQTPTDLDGALSKRLASLVRQHHDGIRTLRSDVLEHQTNEPCSPACWGFSVCVKVALEVYQWQQL